MGGKNSLSICDPSLAEPFPALGENSRPPERRRRGTVVGKIKKGFQASSSKFINAQRWVAGRFSWQEGFGAFSYSRSQLNAVISYIDNQQKHHANKSFRQKDIELLERFNVPYDPRYVFKPTDE